MRALKLAVVSAGLFAAGLPAYAAPLATSASPAVAQHNAQLEAVQWRGRGYGGYGYRGYGYGGYGYRGYGYGIGAGIVAGAIIADYAYRPRRGYYYDTYAYDGPYYYPSEYRGDPREICARNFKSFEWSTGYYTTYGGEHRLCPYLR